MMPPGIRRPSTGVRERGAIDAFSRYAYAFVQAGGAAEIARRAGHASVAFTYDRCGHLLPEADKQAATKLEVVRAATRLA
jgi:hypothetical protein